MPATGYNWGVGLLRPYSVVSSLELVMGHDQKGEGKSSVQLMPLPPYDPSVFLRLSSINCGCITLLTWFLSAELEIIYYGIELVLQAVCYIFACLMHSSGLMHHCKRSKFIFNYWMSVHSILRFWVDWLVGFEGMVFGDDFIIQRKLSISFLLVGCESET